MNYNQLINISYRILQRNKIILSKNKENLIINEIYDRIFEALDSITVNFNLCLEIGSRNNLMQKLLIKKDRKIQYINSDLSYKLLQNLRNENNKFCFDHDVWCFKENAFDLIISNFYLHWSNNLEFVMQNIINSLKKNGFFICSLPGPNTMIELRKSMFHSDIECYNGTYQRFINLPSIGSLNILFSKVGFKIPLIQVDNLTFNYRNFNDLLKEIKLLSETNVQKDRKNFFEKKSYFKKVEEYYWNNFSIKNKLPVTYQIFYLSGWKEN